MAGVYIHIPFCKQKCTYCDFHFSTTYSAYRDKMIQCILTELKNRKEYLDGQIVETIYFGGGTPSLLSEHELNSILETVQAQFNCASKIEITLESNPDDINNANLEMWKRVGINRLSIGLQSFKESDLKWMNRAHSAKESIECLDLAQTAGFNNLTIDLIYGLPNLTMEEWEDHIQRIIDKGINHISAYCLTVEVKTALDKWVRDGKMNLPSNEEQSAQFLRLVELLEQNGYVQYEISNFCKPGFESKHNSNYWKHEWYIGIGPSAHSFNGYSREWNVANNSMYIRHIESNKRSFDREVLTKKDQFNEMILTGLRTIYGVDLSRLSRLEHLSDSFVEKYKSHIHAGWMKNTDGTLRLTKEGRLKADFIASELFSESD